jgi:tight adherence protein B
VSARRRLRAWRALAAASLALATGGLTATAASAAPTSLRVSEGGGATFPARSLVLSLPGHSSLAPPRVEITENGKPVTGAVVRPVASAPHGDFGVVLAIDVSPSMRGAPLAQAMAAARALAAQRAGMQELGVVTFDRHANVTLPLTSDPQAIAAALRHVPHVGSGAYIYNALTVAVQQLASAQIAAGAVILLSDGASEGAKPVPGHRVTATEIAASASAAHAQIYTVGLRDGSYTPERMSLLARVGGGEFIESNSAQLAGVFTRIESQLTNAYVIHYRSVAPLGHRVAVSVRVDGVPQAATLEYDTPAPPRALGLTPQRRNSFWTSTLALVLFSCAAAVLVGLGVLVFLLPRLRAQGLRRRVGEFTLTAFVPEVVAATPSGTGWLLRPLEKLLMGRAWWERFKVDVDIVPRIERTPIDLAGRCLIAMAALAGLLGLAFGTPVVAILSLPLCPLALNMVIKARAQRQRKLFAQQLPVQLEEMASMMRVGHALMPAIASMAQAAPEPSHGEWARVVADEQLGVPLQDALKPLAARMRSRDIDQVALVAALHTRTGGNMAEVLERVADSVRDRGDLHRELESLTAQARLSRWVVTALPFGVGALITVINPEYEKPLFNTTPGIVLLVFAIGLVTLGSWWMSRITDIEA